MNIDDLYILHYNNDYLCSVDADHYFSKESGKIYAFFDMQSAIEQASKLNKQYRIDTTDYQNETIICEILHYVFCEPRNEFEYLMKDNYPIHMYINYDGSIKWYSDSTYNLWWTDRDTDETVTGFKKGDIVNCYQDKQYIGKYVVLNKPRTIIQYLKTHEKPYSRPFESGYSLIGYCPYDKEINRLEDVSGVYDENLELSKDTIDAAMFAELSEFCKLCTDDLTPSENSVSADDIFEKYHKKPDC